MRRRKPADWPRYMTARRLKNRSVAYFWTLPTWARGKRAGGEIFPIKSRALGHEYGEACEQARALNAWLDTWRTGRKPEPHKRGSVDWLCETFLASDKCQRRAASTQTNYRGDLDLIRNHVLKNGQRLGERMVAQITEGVVDRLYEILREHEGKPTLRRANGCMIAARRAWNVVRRLHPIDVPSVNPFSKMGLEHSTKATTPASREQMEAFVAASDRLGLSILGTAAMICFELVQRPDDVFTELAWTHYRPPDHPDEIMIRDSKTAQETWLPLMDDDGTPFYADLEARLSRTPRVGALIIMSPRPDRKRKIFLPYEKSWRSTEVRRIRKEAELPVYVTMTSFRHGGLTEMGDAELTDQEMQAHGRHKTRAMLSIYAKRTLIQKRNAARKRLARVGNVSTNRAQMSE